MRRLRERLRGGADYQRVDVAAAELSGGESEVEEAAGACARAGARAPDPEVRKRKQG